MEDPLGQACKKKRLDVVKALLKDTRIQQISWNRDDLFAKTLKERERDRKCAV